MDKYEVVIKSRHDDNKWTMTWEADCFADAEAKTIDVLIKTRVASWSEIIAINRDYVMTDEWGYKKRTLEERASSPGHP